MIIVRRRKNDIADVMKSDDGEFFKDPTNQMKLLEAVYERTTKKIDWAKIADVFDVNISPAACKQYYSFLQNMTRERSPYTEVLRVESKKKMRTALHNVMKRHKMIHGETTEMVSEYAISEKERDELIGKIISI